VVYFLIVEAHNVSTVGDEPYIRMKKVAERPIPLSTTSIPHSQSSPTFSCTLQNPFSRSFPVINADSQRHYMLRLSCANTVTLASSVSESLLIQLQERQDPFRTLPIPYTLPAGQTANSYTSFDIFTAISFGDQRGPTLPSSDWDVMVAYTGDDSAAANNCTILDIALETHDSPLADAHLSPSQQFSLLLTAASLALPTVPELVFRNTAFSVTAWVANMADYYVTDDDSDASNLPHTIIRHANLYSMGTQTDGTVFGTDQHHHYQ